MPQSSGGHLAVVASVRCLECGALYAKPAGGGTVRSNPGCPECGYLGWMTVPARPSAHGDESEEARRHGARNGTKRPGRSGARSA
jgi:predicted  nucleic acid-binding Zn-ribbon protein